MRTQPISLTATEDVPVVVKSPGGIGLFGAALDIEIQRIMSNIYSPCCGSLNSRLTHDPARRLCLDCLQPFEVLPNAPDQNV